MLPSGVMSYPYPAGFGGPSYQPVAPVARFKPLRRVAIAAMVLCCLTAVAYAVEVAVIWFSIDDFELALAQAITDDNPEALDEAVRTMVTGQLVGQLCWSLLLAAGIVFLVWLSQARENTEVLAPTTRHRLGKGWAIGSWFCPGVQFWFPLTIVDDVWRASVPAPKPGMKVAGGGRGLVYGWWSAWAFFWLITLASVPFVFISVVGWLSDVADAEAAGEPIDDVTMRNDLVRFIRMLTIGGGVCAALLAVAAILVCLVIWRITTMQDTRRPDIQLPGLRPTPVQHGYGPAAVRPYQPPAGGAPFPTYGAGPQDRR